MELNYRGHVNHLPQDPSFYKTRSTRLQLLNSYSFYKRLDVTASEDAMSAVVTSFSIFCQCETPTAVT